MERYGIDNYYYETNKYGYCVDEEGKGTDPYHHLSYSIGWDVNTLEGGGEDYLICFDYVVLERHVAFHSVVNTDSGGFIDTVLYEVVKHENAIEYAKDIVYGLADVVFENYPWDETLDPECEQYTPNEINVEEVAERFATDVKHSLMWRLGVDITSGEGVEYG